MSKATSATSQGNRPPTRSNQAAAGGRTGDASSSNPIVADDARIVPLVDLTAQAFGKALAELAAPLKVHVSAWAKSPMNGKFISSSTPSQLRAQLATSLPGLDDNHRSSILAITRSRILNEVTRDAASIDEGIHSLWLAADPNPPRNGEHGGGGISHGGGGDNIPPPPPVVDSTFQPPPIQSQQNFQPPFGYSQYSNPWASPLPQPAGPTKFVFGRRDTPMSPVALLQTFQTPSQPNYVPPSQQNRNGTPNPFYMGLGASLPVASALSSNVRNLPAGSSNPLANVSANTNAQEPIWSQQQFVPSSQTGIPLPPQLMPSSMSASSNQPQQQVSSNTLYPALSQLQQSQQFQLPNQIQMQGSQAQALNFHQGDISSKPLMPWDIEAMQRGPSVQDEGMMPGFSRRSIIVIIEHAIEQRKALGTSVSTTQLFDKVAYPLMQRFDAADFLATRRAYYVAVRASVSSCLFKDFKHCMSDKCRTAAMRKFKLQDETQWLALSDAKLQHWLGVHFGPKSKEDAMVRLSNVKFPAHSDATDSQANFVNKLDLCVYEFELVMNDIANTHTTWVADPSKLSTGVLSVKEVMEIWRKKFPKQERNPFSVQLKECRDFMERNRDGLFNDIVTMLSNHFSDIDSLVAEGKVQYSTMPSKGTTSIKGFHAPYQPEVHGRNRQLAKNDPHGPASSPMKRPRSPRSRVERQEPTARPGAADKTRPPRKVVPGHARGICCGSLNNHFGLGCSASTCPFWGTKYDKNKNGHTFKDSDKEESVLVDKEIYDGLLKIKPGILIKWAAAKDQQIKARLQARISAIAAGQSDPDDNEQSDNASQPEDDVAAGLDEFQQENDDSDTNVVNEDHCCIASLSSSGETAAEILTANKMKQFFGVSEVIDAEGNASAVKTLMDPGAEYNIVCPSVRDACAIETMPVQVCFFQGKKKQCVVNEVARCRFKLQRLNGDYTRHVEWCTVADLGYELLLGRKFCFDNGFTRFDSLLQSWQPLSAPIPDDNIAYNSALSTEANDQIGTAVQQTSTSDYVFIKFSRIDTPSGEAKYKRQPKAMRCAVPCMSSFNCISDGDLTASNEYSALKILNSRVVDSCREVQLQFIVESNASDLKNVQFIDWFKVVKSFDKGFVQLAMSSAAGSQLLTKGNIRQMPKVPSNLPFGPRAPVQQLACGPQPMNREPAVHDNLPKAMSKKKLDGVAAYEQRRLRKMAPLQSLNPVRANGNLGLLRFTRLNVKGRTAAVVEIDDSAAHNVIDKRMLASNDNDSAIVQFDRKECGGVSMVLLEFSLECNDKSESKIRLREWFRIADCVDNRQLLIRGLFGKDRLQEQALLNGTSPTKRSAQDELHRDHDDAAPSRQKSMAALSRDERVERFKAKRQFEASAVEAAANSRFVSYHPVSHYKLQRKAEPPVHPLTYCRDHASAKINSYQNKTMKAALRQAQLAHEIKTKKRVIKSMIELLPASEQNSEKAAIAALSTAPYFINFEAGIDDLHLSALQAQIAASAESSTAATCNWQGDPTFKLGMYMEIHGAVTNSELNGKRIRLYDKSDTPMVWLIRVLGKNAGLWKCNEKFLRPLPAAAQGAARPASCDAGFLDVAIDSAGQPTGEQPQMAHRQFGAEYSAELTIKINDLKARFPHVFSKDVSEPCGFEKMNIKLIPNAILPSKSRFYRNTPKMKEEVKRQIQEQLDWGAIKKAETPHCSDILLVKRPHMPGQWRFVVNFQKLNEATVPEQLIMPDPASQHAKLAGCKIFGALDLSSYFRQLQLDESCQLLTGFATDEGTFVHTRVPMGIRNAPSFSQRVLQDALASDPILGPLGIKNYFDDVPFGAKSEEEFLSTMQAMLEFCAKWKLKINPEKSIFGVTSITHVGFVVSANGVAIDPERNRDIADLQAPKSVKKVQSVLGVLNYVRNFVPNFSDKAKHLTDKLSAAPGKFEWNADDQRKFEKLKALVTAAPLLAQLDYSKQIHIRCDASRFGAGAVLFQYDDAGRELVACYASRKFLPAETRWSTFQQEASTVVWALERFLEYTQGYHVIVECDHRNISFVKRSSMPQLARWRMRLQDHDFSIHFLSGHLNLVADGLSRSHVDDVEVTLADSMPECSLLYAKPSSTTDYASIAAIEIAPYVLRSSKQSTAKPKANGEEETDADDDAESDSDNSDSDTSVNDDDTVDTVPRFGPHGELLHTDDAEPNHREEQPWHVTAPFIDVETEMEAVHNDLVGHKGVYVSLQRLLRNGRTWGSRKQMLEDVDAFIQGCAVCQKMKKRRERVTVDRHTIAGSPFSEISIDVLKLPQVDARGNKYCIVIVDSFSRWTSLTACANKSALDAARALVQFIGNFGAPLRIRSDGGGEFVNGVITSLTRMMGVSPLVVQAYTPTANGIVERANRAILEQVREMCMCQRLVLHTHHQWGDLLPLVQRTMNASIHASTGTSPSRILFGDCLDLDRAILTRIPDGKTFDVSNYCDALAVNQRVIIEEADRFQAIVCDKVVAKSAAKNRDRPAQSFAVNDWVLVKPQPKFPLHKLAPRWLGPFRIHSVSADSDKVLVVDTVADKIVKVLKRQLEHFNTARVSDVVGLTKIAETDSFEFPVESIMGHALISDEGVGINPVQLHRDFVRGARRKTAFQFLIKWTGYEEPTWVAFKDAKNLVQFPGYVSVFQGLNML